MKHIPWKNKHDIPKEVNIKVCIQIGSAALVSLWRRSIDDRVVGVKSRSQK